MPSTGGQRGHTRTNCVDPDDSSAVSGRELQKRWWARPSDGQAHTFFSWQMCSVVRRDQTPVLGRAGAATWVGVSLLTVVAVTALPLSVLMTTFLARSSFLSSEGFCSSAVQLPVLPWAALRAASRPLTMASASRIASSSVVTLFSAALRAAEASWSSVSAFATFELGSSAASSCLWTSSRSCSGP